MHVKYTITIASKLEKQYKILINLIIFFRVKNVTNKDGSMTEKMVETSELKLSPPFNISTKKNIAYNVFSREFLEWALEKSKKAKVLLEWSRDTLTPDEHYWLMLNSLEEAPGSTPKTNTNPITPFIKWKSSRKYHCRGNTITRGGRDTLNLS